MSDHSSRAPRRVRNELRFRKITVTAKTLIAGSFWRIDFAGTDLAGFTSPGFDDHIKVFFSDPQQGEPALPQITDDGIVWQDGVRPVARDYTPLYFDGERQTLTLDFYIHDGGIASGWAEQAQIGDKLIVGGPRGSLVVPEDYAFQLYVCDESGLPAFKRRRETLQSQLTLLYAFANGGSGSDYLGDLHGVDAHWLGNGNMQPQQVTALLSTLDSVTLPAEDYFIWLTGEGEAVKRLSDYFIEQRGCDAAQVRAVAYWHQK